jgi:hypothetical protein
MTALRPDLNAIAPWTEIRGTRDVADLNRLPDTCAYGRSSAVPRRWLFAPVRIPPNPNSIRSPGGWIIAITFSVPLPKSCGWPTLSQFPRLNPSGAEQRCDCGERAQARGQTDMDDQRRYLREDRVLLR